MRPTDRTRFRKDAEARFPINIDIARGESWPYAEMLAWCQANVAAGPGRSTDSWTGSAGMTRASPSTSRDGTF